MVKIQFPVSYVVKNTIFDFAPIIFWPLKFRYKILSKRQRQTITANETLMTYLGRYRYLVLLKTRKV